MVLVQKELKNAYIWEYMNLNLIFDFSVDTTFWDYTYRRWAGNWLVIHNWYCDWWGSSYWDGTVYKTVNAHKYWSRIKFWFNNTSYTWNRWWWITSAPWDSAVVAWTIAWGIAVSGWNMNLYIYNDGTGFDKAVSLTLWQQYYLDTKFDNWLFEVILLDASLNVIDTNSQDLWVSTLPYSWFSGWEHSATPWFFRIYEYREAYKA